MFTLWNLAPLFSLDTPPHTMQHRSLLHSLAYYLAHINLFNYDIIRIPVSYFLYTLSQYCGMFDSEVRGVRNCGEIDKYFGGFLKKLLRVKQSTNTSMIYAETGSFALSVSVKLSIVKYWLKVINLRMRACVEIRHVQNVITGP